MKEVLKAMFRLKWNWILLIVLGICQYYDWMGVDGITSFLAFIIFWFLYEITAKNRELKRLNGANKDIGTKVPTREI